MKAAVRLAILVAALLLVTNMAFAQCPIDNQLVCYEIVATAENGYIDDDEWEVCLDSEGTGTLYSENTDDTYDLYLFGGGPGWFNTSGDPAFAGKPRYTTWIAQGRDEEDNESGFLQPIGDGVGADAYMLTGEGVRNGTRYTIIGNKVPCAVPI